MKSDASPLVSKLTLLVLTLILGCLVLLVVRAYLPGRSRAVTTVAENDTAASADDSQPGANPLPAPIVKRNSSSASAFRGPTNVAVPIARRTEPELRTEAASDRATIRATAFGSGGEPAIDVIETLAANGSALLAGIVTLSGTPKSEVPIALGSTCGPLQSKPVTTRHYVVGPQGQLANVVVSIRSGLLRKYGPVQPAPVLDQVGCMFEPYMMGVAAGQTFQIRNSDPTMHNVHATPKINREFNLGQPLQGQVTERSLPLPEMFIRLKCDVHPWMFAYVSVFDHPYFAVTDTNGFFQLPAQIPAGNYVIGASHLKTGIDLTQEVTLREGEQRSIQFQFTVPSSAQPQGNVVRSN